MIIQKSIGRKMFLVLNSFFLVTLAVSCILPFIHVLAISFSSNSAAQAGDVGLWPVKFTLSSYNFLLTKQDFISALSVSFKRVLLGVLINMLMIVITAYPLSKSNKEFRARTFFSWVFAFTILFSGGLIPWYLTIHKLGMINTIWALVLPGAVPVFNILLVLNFFRSLPKELEESAFIDGAGHWTILFRIFLPVSLPVLATVALFSIVSHWNSWFDGLVLMSTPSKYPLQTYLYTIIAGVSIKKMGIDKHMLNLISEKTVKSAQVFLGALPVLCVYPFLQRYFMTGIVLGSVKE